MVRIVTVSDIQQMVRQVGMDAFMSQLIEALRNDFRAWESFQKSPRFVNHLNHGVVELMPICGKDYFAFKYVNGHPDNPKQHKQTVVATGMLTDVETGYPLLISEMTLLTAFRTAAVSGLASSYLARKDSKRIGIIGTGSQAEFQVLAHHAALDIQHIQYFDIDDNAMTKFSNNLKNYHFDLVACEDAAATLNGVDIIITATAEKIQARILKNEWVESGVHINAIGGDCSGKTELDPDILHRSKIVVEYLEQTKQEGEIQDFDISKIHAELWQIVKGEKPGRESENEITLFDSVGFALEDYSILKHVYLLAEKMNIGEQLNMIPDIEDPKDLFQVVR